MDLEVDADLATELCRESQHRLLVTIVSLDEAAVRAPSLLPSWTRIRVLTHLARNADAHSRRIAGALEDCDIAKYAGGPDPRAAEIDEGAGRSSGAILADLETSQTLLEGLMPRSPGWPNAHFMGGGY